MAVFSPEMELTSDTTDSLLLEDTVALITTNPILYLGMIQSRHGPNPIAEPHCCTPNFFNSRPGYRHQIIAIKPIKVQSDIPLSYLTPRDGQKTAPVDDRFAPTPFHANDTAPIHPEAESLKPDRGTLPTAGVNRHTGSPSKTQLDNSTGFPIASLNIRRSNSHINRS
jgi:hypothetical protein